jgi:hypothetical protein
LIKEILMPEKKTPEVIEDADLDETSGGIALLLPAVQKVREAAATTSTPTVTLNKTGAGQLD